MRARSFALCLQACAVLCLACATPPSATRSSAHHPTRWSSEAWLEGDALFHRDARWLGGDAAFSVELDGERVLWLFGDSFVTPHATPGASDRRGARMVRNSVGLQLGRDAARAPLELFFGRDAHGAPDAFFAGDAAHWLWPAHGLCSGTSLILFLHRMVADARAAPLGFRPDGVEARLVHNPEAPPSAWRIERIEAPEVEGAGLIGAAVLREGEHVYAFGVRDPGDRALTLVRFAAERFERGELRNPEVWDGRAFVVGARAAAIAAPVATELSLTRTAFGYALVSSDGFGDAPLAVRLSPALTGPFGAPVKLALPHGLPRDDKLLVYAAKAHAALAASRPDCALVATYATNSLDAERLMRDLALYFPRLVCLKATAR